MRIVFDLQQQGLLEQYQADIWRLLVEANHEFIPPLSVRDFENVVFNDKMELQDDGHPHTFFRQVLSETIIGVLDADRLVAFLSFEEDYVNDDLRQIIISSSWYVNALIVSKSHRRKGLASKLYDTLEAHAARIPTVITTRTWSTNHSHINLVLRRGYELILTLEDHRGTGMHTVYYYFDPLKSTG